MRYASRIKRSQDISTLFKIGKRWEGKRFTIIYHQNEIQHTRLAVLVSKTIGNAIVRNQVKRNFREVFRINSFNIKKIDILVKTRPGIAEVVQQDIIDSFNQWILLVKK